MYFAAIFVSGTLAQLVARRSHNPKVVSSILTGPSFFVSQSGRVNIDGLFFCLDAGRVALLVYLKPTIQDTRRRIRTPL